MRDTDRPQDDPPQLHPGEAPCRPHLAPPATVTLTTARLRGLRTSPLVHPVRDRGDPRHARRSAVEMVLIDASPTAVDLSWRALKACALPSLLTVLPQASDVAAFVRQAATSPSLGPPRLIIAEAWIPGMAVEELLAVVRAVPAYAAVPAVLFSALPEEEGQRRGAQCGAAGFVHKPSEWWACVAAVATIVRRWGGGGEQQPPSPAPLVSRTPERH